MPVPITEVGRQQHVAILCKILFCDKEHLNFITFTIINYMFQSGHVLFMDYCLGTRKAKVSHLSDKRVNYIIIVLYIFM